jgi:hypothetical protein
MKKFTTKLLSSFAAIMIFATSVIPANATSIDF